MTDITAAILNIFAYTKHYAVLSGVQYSLYEAIRSTFVGVDAPYTKQYAVFSGCNTPYTKQYAVLSGCDTAYIKQYAVFLWGSILLILSISMDCVLLILWYTKYFDGLRTVDTLVY